MATHDYAIANGTGAAVRSDLNGALAAIVSNNSSATEPATMYAYQWWADTTTGLLKQRNSANSAWVTIGTLASANLGLLPLAGGTMTGVLAVTAGTAALPGIAVSGDLNTGLVSPGADQLAITTGGTSRLAVSTTAVSSTLAVDVPLGAVGTPSITFTGDLNTGIYSPGADQVAISTGGTERMRIRNNGTILLSTGGNDSAVNARGVEINVTSGFIYCAVDSDTVAYFNRRTNDGTLIELRQDNTTEGSISVSGTTVSYNGAHLSRWSQLPDGATRVEILRGTVLSNIDEMCSWGDEDNEQLNRIKVSDVEGDKNVSGVFQCWDDDDDTYTNDFYCAMTGDFIIRIAEGVTVQRGDLLMSAGDGTAKPQDDDIIRSKTIAKVTSTHVTCTYEDGSYCVPCVLMAS